MIKYVIKRIILAIITSFLILSLTFIAIKLLPFEIPKNPKVETMWAYMRHQVGLGYVKVVYYQEQPSMGKLLWSYQPHGGPKEFFYQTPIMEQYFSWVKNILTKWDWGTSMVIFPNNPVMKLISQNIKVTIKINVWSVLISVPLGIALGVLAALKKNKPTDHIISTLVMIFISIPSFVMITFLILIFGYNLHWLPTKWPFLTDPLSVRVLGYILPVACLSFGSICGYCRFTRAELCEVMSSEYLLLARTKGLTKRQAIIRHALRNAMVPIVPSILAEVIGVLSGSMILENLYGIPGIGALFIRALNEKDYNVLFVDMAVFTTIGLLAGVVLDISYGFIDPRIRMGAKK